MPKPKAEQLATRRRRFRPLPPQHAELIYLLDDEAVPIEIRMSEAKPRHLRSLFADKRGSEMCSGLADELLPRFGITVAESRP